MVSRYGSRRPTRRRVKAAPKRKSTYSKSGRTSTGRRVKPRRAPRSAVRSTKRKQRGTRKSPRSRGSSKAAAELAVFHDPFSKACQQPRIPDGKATTSLGTRLQAVVARTVNDVASNGLDADTQHIFLFPGISSNVLIYQTPKALGNGSPSTERDFEVLGYDEHAPMELIVRDDGFEDWPSPDPDADPTAGSTGEEIRIKNSQQIAKWRLVSAGLSMKLVNNDDSNDGWWEATRLNQAMSTKDYMITTMNNSNGNSKTAVVPSLDFVKEMAASNNLVQEPSYQTGLLKDLHKQVFTTHPVTDQIAFKNMYENFRLKNNTNSALADNDLYVRGLDDQSNRMTYFNEGSARARDFIAKNFCQEHDIVYIRVHGRTPTEFDIGGTSKKTEQTKLLMHAVGNYEVMYDSVRDLSKFQIAGENSKAMDSHYQAKKKSTAAADVNMGTSALS